MKKYLYVLLCLTSGMLFSGETLIWSDALNDALRWEPAQIRRPWSNTPYPVEKKSSNEFTYAALQNQNTILFETQKDSGQTGELWAAPAFPLQTVESLKGAESLTFELLLTEPAPEKLTQSAILLTGKDRKTISIPFHLTKQGSFERITVQLPGTQPLEGYDRLSVKLATNENRMAWQWRKASLEGRIASPPPRQSPIDTVLAVRPLAPCAMFYESENPAFNFVIPSEARYTVKDADGKPVLSGTVTPGKNTLSKLPCGYYFLSLQAPDREYNHPRNFCVVHNRVTLPAGKESPYGINSHLDAGWPYYQWMPNRAFPGPRYEEIVNAAVRAGFQLVRGGSNYEAHFLYAPENLVYGREMKKSGISTIHSIAPCGGEMKDLRAIFRLGETIARDFGDVNSYTEFWNEPQAFGRPMAWNYAAAAKAFYLGTREGNPNGKVLTASFLYPSFPDAALKSGLSEFFDAFNIHVYSGLDTYASELGKYRKMLKKHGLEDCSIYITECSSFDEGPAKGTTSYREGAKMQSFEQEMGKADFFTKSQLTMQENGVASTQSFVLPVFHEYNGEKDWGLMRDDYSAKPGLAAFSVLNTLLAPAEYLGTYRPAPGVKGHLFLQSDGTQTLAYWWEGPLPKGRKEIPETLTLNQRTGSYCCRNLLGTPSTVQAKFGKLQLPLSAQTAYVCGLKGLKPTIPAPRPGKLVSHTNRYDRSIIIDLFPKEGLKNSPLLNLANPTSPKAKIEVHVYNMSREEKKGTVTLQGAVRPVTSRELRIKPMGVEKFDLEVEFALPRGEVFGDLAAVGNFGEKPSSPAVMPICYPESVELRAVPFAGADQAKTWRAMAAGPMRITDDAAEKAVAFRVKVPHRMSNWIYPRFYFPKGTLRGAVGVEFEMKVDAESVKKGYQDPLVYFEGTHIDYAPPATPDWKKIQIYFVGAVSEPEEVTSIAIGFNTLNIDNPVEYKLRNLRILSPKK